MTLTADQVVAARNVALLLSLLAAAVALLALGGWALNIESLKSISPDGVTMKANTAMGILLSGAALALLSRSSVSDGARLFATMVACGSIALGTLTLGESFFGWDLGIDQWLFPDAPSAMEANPGRMSPPSAFCFVLIGITLVLASHPLAAQRHVPAVAALSVTVLLLGGLGLLGHLSFVLFNIRFWNYAGLAMHTAAALFLLGCALLAWVRSVDGLTWATDATTTAGFAAGMMSIVVAAGISYSFTHQLGQDASEVTRSEEVLKEIQELMVSQRDLTLSLGRYLLTRDEASIVERAHIREAIDEDTKHIRRLTSGNLRQQDRLARVEHLTGQRFAMSDRIIDMARQQNLSSGGATAAAGRATSPLGSEYPKIGLDIDSALKEIETEERSLLQNRLSKSNSSATRTFLLMPVGVYLSLTLLLLGLFFLNAGNVERKRIGEINARIASIVESSDDAIISKTLGGVITSWNAGAERMFGYSRQEAVGKPMLMIFPPDRTDEEGEIIARIARGESIDHFETVRVGKGGKLIDVAVTISPIKDSSGRIVGASKIARDITERRRADEALRGRDAAQAANRMKSEFLANMSHELRTPLNAIIGFTGTLLMKLPGPLNTDQEKQLKTVQTSARHLLTLINDLLDVEKVSAGKFEPHFETVVCQNVIEEVAATLRPEADRKGIGFKVAAPEKDLVMLTDRRALRQIVLNLANNAVKFTDYGGVQISVRGRQENGTRVVEICVEDTGKGIRTDDQAKLFEPFTQVDVTRSEPRKGTGLGLHISRKLAESMGGRITVRSDYGKGSTFTLTLSAE